MAGEIFISYRRSDQDKARLLHALLKQRGVDAWYDALVGAGEDWRHKTAQALGAAPIFVLLFSKVASESDDISKELAAATFSKKLVIPVRIDDIKPEGAFLHELASRNWFDAFEDTEARFEILADKLAALVKGGPEADVAAFNLGSAQPAPVIKPAQKPLLKRPAVLAGLAAAGVALIAAVAMFAMGPQAIPPSAAPTSQRVAFFGFTVDADDPVATSIAKAATDEVFEVMRANRLETSARTETLGTPADGRFARAEELGALYALSGEVRSEDGEVSIAIRFEDVSSRMTLSEKSIRGVPAEVAFLPIRAAIQAADTVRCFINERSQLTRETSELLKLVADVCRDPRSSNREDAALAYSALASADPDSPTIKSVLARYLANSAPGLPESAQPARIAAAEAALKQATELDPKLPSLAVARLHLARAKGASMAELETAYLAELGVPGLRADSGHYSRLNTDLGKMFLIVGRVREAEPFFQLAMTNDPLQRDAPFFLADASAIRWQTSVAQARFEQSFSRRPTEWHWETWISSAIFLGAGDSEAMLTSPPSMIPRRVVDCWLGIRKISILKEPNTRTAGATKVAECLAGGAITEAAALASFAALGDFNAAFTLASKQTLTIPSTNRSALESLFWPTSRAMRADPRFLPLVKKLGLMEYWRATKSQPDACETEDVPFCRELKAAKP